MQAFFDTVLRFIFDGFQSSDRLGGTKKNGTPYGVPDF
jgi:hypothetical protein